MKDSFLGVPYPLEKHPRGYFRTQSGLNQIKSDLLALILTNQGERCMLPTYGADLRRFLFEPADNALISQVRSRIESQLRRHEPRVVIEQINVSLNPDASLLNSEDDLTEQGAILYIQILFYDFDSIKEVQSLELHLPLSSG